MIMTDLHTHVMFDIDDGADDIEQSRAMLSEMKKIGVTKVVATPHCDISSTSPEEFLKKRDVRAGRLKDIARECGIELLCGCELCLSTYLLRLDDISGFCIEGTNSILVEMPFTREWNRSVFDCLANLGDYFNVRPIVAHVERYLPIKRRLDNAQRLIELGAILQLDAESLFDNNLRRVSKKLLKKGLISVVASDAHNMTTRPPHILADAYDELERLCGESVVAEMKMEAEQLCSSIPRAYPSLI